MTCSTRDLLNTFAARADRKTGLPVAARPLGDTITQHGRMVLSVPGGLAEFELDAVRARTSVLR